MFLRRWLMKKKLPLIMIRVINIIITMIAFVFVIAASIADDEYHDVFIAILIIILVIDIGFMLIFWRCPHCGKLLQFTGPLEHCGHCGKKIDQFLPLPELLKTILVLLNAVSIDDTVLFQIIAKNTLIIIRSCRFHVKIGVC